MATMTLSTWPKLTHFSEEEISEGYGDFATDAVEDTAQPARSYETFARDFVQGFKRHRWEVLHFPAGLTQDRLKGGGNGMSEAENRALAYRYVEEVFNQGNLTVIDELIDPAFIEHNPFPGQAPGIAGEKQAVSMSRAAYPDLHTTIEDIITEDDMMVIRLTARGTQRGEFMGNPATGEVTTTEIHILRIANGKAVEHWSEVNCWC